MDFDYETPKEYYKEPVMAELFHMEGSPDCVCLNIHSDDGYSVTTLYHDGQVITQGSFTLGNCSIKKFYKGDKITITF